MNMTSQMIPSTSSLLFSDGPAAEVVEHDLYGWLIGGWDLDVTDIDADGTRHKSKGECHFTWALEGRAVQDVWITPPVSQRKPGDTRVRNRYGTTIRTYDAQRGMWRVTWINPATGAFNVLFARRVNGDIVQEGTLDDGRLTRWCFRDITDDSFRWTAEVSSDQGATWQQTVEFLGRRKSRQPLR